MSADEPDQSAETTLTASGKGLPPGTDSPGGLQFASGELLDGRFRIVREVGQGGMGVVYQAIDEKLQRRIALKCARARYGRYLIPEVRNASEVSHPNICRLYEMHTAATRLGEVDFITMEYLEGETLASRLKRGRMTGAEALTIARQMCEGLAEAHRNGVVHGDIKGANVILASGGAGRVRAVITDFGLARILGAETREACGTPGYMAPEVTQGGATSTAADVYAMGKVLLGMAATGHNRWDPIVSRCLEQDPSRRYQDGGELAAALAPSRTRLRLLAAVAAVILATLTGWVTYRNATAPPDTVQLAVLPFSIEGIPLVSADGISEDVASRLTGARRQFTVLSPADLKRRDAVTADSARAKMGATHALQVRLKTTPWRVQMKASLIDLNTHEPIRDLTAEYSAQDLSTMARALLGTVTGAFNLKKSVPKELVSTAAYPFYVQGLEVLRADNRHPEAALPLLEKAAALDPESALPVAELAMAQVDEFLTGGGGTWLERARGSVARAKSINPDAAPVLLASGLVKEQGGAYEAAIGDFTRATELEPGNPAAWRQLAVAFEHGNRTREAAAAYARAIAANPSYYRTYIDFGNFYYYRGEFPLAEQNYRHVIVAAPQLPVGHMNLGLALMQEGRFAEAESAILAAVRLRDAPDALMNLGAVYYAEGKFADAAQSFQASLASGSPSSIQYKNLGDARRHLGQTGKEKAAYRKAIALAEREIGQNPRLGVTRALLGLLAARTGDQRRASLELTQALAMEPENAAVMREAAIAFEAIGERGRALELLRGAPSQLIRELNRNPDVAGLRQDSRFVALLK